MISLSLPNMSPDPILLAPQPGSPAPLGPSRHGRAVNFAVFSEHATQLELCLFDGPDAARESLRLPMQQTDDIWHLRVPDVPEGQLYGFRAHGPFEPERGLRFNPTKVVLDPYARLVGRDPRWDNALLPYTPGGPEPDLTQDPQDSAPHAPLARIVDTAFDWGDDAPPRTPWDGTVLYEAHLKGLSQLHPAVPQEHRGTYLGLTCPALLDHLVGLGVTAVELLPIQHFVHDRFLVERGLRNYWGYSPLAYFAPHAGYAARAEADPIAQFKTMVRALHRAGLEVILDVVYNHTCEGNHLGHMLSFRGLDNSSYYTLSHDHPRFTADFTGCGNSLQLSHPRVLQMVTDSLRYWVTEMHVDGFRFDLATTLARVPTEFGEAAPFLSVCLQDPVLSQVKLIAEPWDVGPGGYRLGEFPRPWSEWNDRFRDCVRRYWRGDPATAAEMGIRLAGSPDIFAPRKRGPRASINFVTCHDGFTLRDVVSYERKHNEANLEDNRDGSDHNSSWNCGIEGPTSDPAILALRRRLMRNALASLFLAQGVPMLLAGDEFGRTQRGNNNAYCQDTPLSWIAWSLEPWQRALLHFTQRLSRMRRDYPSFRTRAFRALPAVPHEHTIRWLRPDGQELPEFGDPHCPAFAFLLEPTPHDRSQGQQDRLMIALNPTPEPIAFVIQELGPCRLLLDTFAEDGQPSAAERSNTLDLQPRSLVVVACS